MKDNVIKILLLTCIVLFNYSYVYSQYGKGHNRFSSNDNNKIFFAKTTSQSKMHEYISLGVLSTKPEFVLTAFAGGSLPLNELKGDLSSISLFNGATSSTGYFEAWGYNNGVLGKLPVGRKGNFMINISLIYNRFFNSGGDSTGTVTIEPNLNIFQSGLGAEWAFNKIGNVTPFIGAEFNANIYHGSIEFIEIEGGPGISYNYNRNVRYGFSAGAGIEYSINKTFGLTGGVKYNWTNLIGKKYDESGAHDLDDEAFIVNGISIKQRNIAFLNFYAGVALYIWD